MTLLLRPFHRGAYEHLWAEQRYRVMALAWNCYQGLSKRFTPKPPHILSVLTHLNRYLFEPQHERLNAVLNAFGHLNDRLDRRQREELVEGFLAGSPAALDRFFELVLLHNEKFLFGCRLFYPERALNKFWDFSDGAGLWICLGPFLGLLSSGAVRLRLEHRGGVSGPALDAHIEALRHGLQRSAYETWPPALRQALEDLAAVAIPGERVFLHPRFPFPLPNPAPDTIEREHAGLMALESYWDRHPHTLPELPVFEDWLTEYTPENLPVARFTDHSPADIYEQLRQGFQQQMTIEPHPKPTTTDGAHNAESGAGPEGPDSETADQYFDDPGFPAETDERN